MCQCRSIAAIVFRRLLLSQRIPLNSDIAFFPYFCHEAVDVSKHSRRTAKPWQPQIVVCSKLSKFDKSRSATGFTGLVFNIVTLVT